MEADSLRQILVFETRLGATAAGSLSTDINVAVVVGAHIPTLTVSDPCPHLALRPFDDPLTGSDILVVVAGESFVFALSFLLRRRLPFKLHYTVQS